MSAKRWCEEKHAAEPWSYRFGKALVGFRQTSSHTFVRIFSWLTDLVPKRIFSPSQNLTSACPPDTSDSTLFAPGNIFFSLPVPLGCARVYMCELWCFRTPPCQWGERPVGLVWSTGCIDKAVWRPRMNSIVLSVFIHTM